MIAVVPRKGRGAVVNPDGRFESQRREALDDGWWQDDNTPPLRTQLSIDTAKSVITYNDSPDIPYDRSINPYRGCEHVMWNSPPAWRALLEGLPSLSFLLSYRICKES